MASSVSSVVKSGSPKRLKSIKGLLITCDPPLKQYLLRLNEEAPAGFKFVTRDLDECHLFVSGVKFPPQFNSTEQWLKYEVQQWQRKYTFVEEDARVDD